MVVSTRGQPVYRWLREAGYAVPGQIGLATMINDHLEHGIAGIYNDPRSLGALAAEMVVGMVHRHETGLPAEPHFVLSPGTWFEAGTLRPANQ